MIRRRPPAQGGGILEVVCLSGELEEAYPHVFSPMLRGEYNAGIGGISPRLRIPRRKISPVRG